MSTNRGIFDSFPSQAQDRPASPFAADPADPAKKPAAPAASPFTVVDESEGETPGKLPDKRPADSPFQIADPSEGFGFEPPAPPAPASPFEAHTPVAASPFAAAEPAPASPFSKSTPAPAADSPFAAAEPATGVASSATQAALAAFSNWQEPPPAQPFATPAPPAPAAPAQAPPPFTAASAAESPPAPQSPAEPAKPAPDAASTDAPPAADIYSDSSSIRQLELRAIFGVDREMGAEEILQRSRALPGVKNIARVGGEDMATIEAVKALLPRLGFGSGTPKIYLGSVPIEFIREGRVLLAVQTDGGFAPGVRETLMIVGRELSRMA